MTKATKEEDVTILPCSGQKQLTKMYLLAISTLIILIYENSIFIGKFQSMPFEKGSGRPFSIRPRNSIPVNDCSSHNSVCLIPNQQKHPKTKARTVNLDLAPYLSLISPGLQSDKPFPIYCACFPINCACQPMFTSHFQGIHTKVFEPCDVFLQLYSPQTVLMETDLQVKHQLFSSQTLHLRLKHKQVQLC